MRLRLSIWLVCVATVGALGCASEPLETEPAKAKEGTTTAAAVEVPVAYADPSSRIRFNVPSKGIEVHRRTFDPATPPGKVKERIELRQARQLLVRIDAWANPQGLDPEAWIETHASYLNRGGTRFERREVGVGRLPAVIADTPASCQAPNVVTAVFVVDQRVVAVTCRDGEDPATVHAFETVLRSFAMEAAR